MSNFTHDAESNKTSPTDPHESAEFDEIVKSVYAKYVQGIALTRRELLRLAQAAISLCGREGRP